MIKRRFYKHEHGDRDVPSDSDSSSDSEMEAKSTEEEIEEEEEEVEEELEEEDVVAEVRQNNGHCSSSSGLFILTASASILNSFRSIQLSCFIVYKFRM